MLLLAAIKAYFLIGAVVVLILFGAMHEYTMLAVEATNGNRVAREELDRLASENPTRFSVLHLASKVFRPHFLILAHFFTKEGAL